ncbi:MAG: hypothetical protein JWL70_3207 [Acidimicrobiia bacterium]|nr:hypothetical protein [Acidimicrobiia bacterium]
MRLLELLEPTASKSDVVADAPAPAASPPSVVLRLHPRLAVVELDAAARDLATTRLDEIFAGLGGESVGLVEAHGILLDLSGPTLTRLALDGVIRPVVRCTDLPGVPALDASRARRRTERQLDEARRRLAQMRQAATAAADTRRSLEARGPAEEPDDAALAVASARLAASRVELAELVNHLDRDERQRVDLVAERHQLETRHHEVSRRKERQASEYAAAVRNREERVAALSDAESRLAAAAERLERARSQAAVIPPRSVAMAALEAASLEVATAENRLAHLRQLEQQAQACVGRGREAELEVRRAELQAEWDTLNRTDSGPVEAALIRLTDSTSESAAPDPEAEDLARRYASVLEQRARRQRQQRAVSAEQIDEARDAVEKCRWELAEAQRSCRGSVLDQQVRVTIEQTHESVLEAQRRADRILRPGAKRRLHDLARTERDLLGSFGFRSFSDYLLAAASSAQDPAADVRLTDAQRELGEAEERLAALLANHADEQLRALAEQERQIHAEAVALLGHDPGHRVVEALQAWRRVPSDAAEALDAALAAVGIAPAGPMRVEVARAWMAERAVAAQRHGELRSLIEALDAEASALEAGAVPEQTDRGLTAELEAAERRVQQARAERDAMRASIDGTAGPQPRDDRHDADAHLSLATMLSEREAAQRALVEADREVDRWREELGAVQRVFDEVSGQLRNVGDAIRDLERALARRHPQRELLLREQERLASSLGRRRLRSHAHDGGDFSIAQACRDEAMAREALEAAEHEVAGLTGQLAAAHRIEAGAGTSAPQPVDVEQMELYVLGRLASQRSVGIVGSVPVVFEDAFAGLPHAAVVHLLHRLEELSEAVQVLYLTDDPMVLGWASNRPADRVGVAVPSVASASPAPLG